jgi:MtN3 and saliva related transmembrane protein
VDPELSTQVIGWTSSAILVLTIAAQVRKQWRDDTSRGVSPWLFVGQTAASVGFLWYSVLVENGVFVVTNALLLVSALFGLAIVARHRRRARRAGEARRPDADPVSRA